MIKINSIIIAKNIQLMAHPRQNPPAHLYRAGIMDICFPAYIVILKAPFKYAHVKYRIVSHKQPVRHHGFDLLPDFRKSRRIPHRFPADPCQARIKRIELAFRIYQRIIFIGNLPVFYYRNSDCAHPVVHSAAWIFYIAVYFSSVPVKMCNDDCCN